GSRDYFEDRLARQSGGLGTLFVAVTAGPVGSASEVVGTVHLAFGSAWEPEWRALLPDVPSLNGLGVAENSRRLGIATALVAAAERQARRRGLPRLLVGVEPGNHAALALYERLGWRVRPDRPPPGWRPGVHVLVKALQAGEEGRTFGLARRRAAP
ncbi:MAG: GNAT family N-acetyltransferase, partial [Acidimicrobiales bacterium]